jgi:excisionase family DNA binding protein
MEKVLLTPTEAAQALGVGRTKLYELLGSGALASVWIGASRRIPRTAVDAFVAELTARRGRAGAPATAD